MRDFIGEGSICGVGRRDLKFGVHFSFGGPQITFESDIVYPRSFPADRISLCAKVRQARLVMVVRLLTKNNDNEWTLVNDATRTGYSTTPVSPSSKLMLSCGFVDSASEKSTMVAWLAYILR